MDCLAARSSVLACFATPGAAPGAPLARLAAAAARLLTAIPSGSRRPTLADMLPAILAECGFRPFVLKEAESGSESDTPANSGAPPPHNPFDLPNQLTPCTWRPDARPLPQQPVSTQIAPPPCLAHTAPVLTRPVPYAPPPHQGDGPKTKRKKKRGTRTAVPNSTATSIGPKEHGLSGQVTMLPTPPSKPVQPYAQPGVTPALLHSPRQPVIPVMTSYTQPLTQPLLARPV